MNWSLRHRPITPATSVDIVRVDTRGATAVIDASGGLVATVVVDVFEVEGVDVAWEVAQKGETDVDEEVSAAACDDVDTDWWDCGGVRC